jgi:hypothetical protein
VKTLDEKAMANELSTSVFFSSKPKPQPAPKRPKAPGLPTPEPRPAPKELRPGAQSEEGNADALPSLYADHAESEHERTTIRLTTHELKWLKRLALRLNEDLDIRVSQNTLFRALLRVAEDLIKRGSQSNSLIDILKKR